MPPLAARNCKQTLLILSSYKKSLFAVPAAKGGTNIIIYIVYQGSSNLSLEGQSAAEFTLIKLTFLWFSNDLEDSDSSAQVCLIRVRAKLCRSGPDLRMPAVHGKVRAAIFDGYISLPIVFPYFNYKNITIFTMMNYGKFVVTEVILQIA